VFLCHKKTLIALLPNRNEQMLVEKSKKEPLNSTAISNKLLRFSIAMFYLFYRNALSYHILRIQVKIALMPDENILAP
jgi:hypothetical protein